MLAAGGLAAGWWGFPGRPRAELIQGCPLSPGEGSVVVTDQSCLSVFPVAIACTAGAGPSTPLSISLRIGLGKNPREAPGVEGVQQRWDLSVGLDLKP